MAVTEPKLTKFAISKMASPLFPSKKMIHSRISRSTKANKELTRMLEATEWPLVTDYELFRLVQALYKSNKKLNLRHNSASVDDFKRLRRQLRNLAVLAPDPSYTVYAHRILTNSDCPPEEICCAVDPFCYVSHLSAMQRYGLTNRRSEALLLTTPAPQTGKKMVIRKMEEDHGEGVMTNLDEIIPLKLVHHPKRVRKRRIDEFRTNYMGEWVQVRGNLTRIATISQTFLDMLDEPSRCGGMAHIIETWQNHAPIYLDEIIPMIDRARTAITKVRAGYILAELLGFDNSTVTAWKRFAMRGGSRLLDPSKPYAPTYSADWMISINV